MLEIRSNIVAMCTECESVAGSGDTQDGSFIAEIKQDVVSISTALDEYGKARGQVSAAMKAVAGTLASVSRFISDIDGISLQIERIALNAQIKAAHIGAEGAPLGKLAVAIQELSCETKQVTTSMSEHFCLIQSAARQLDLDGDCEGAGSFSADSMVRDLELLAEMLDELNGSIMSAVDEMSARGSSFAVDISRATGGMDFHRRISDAVHDGVSAIEDAAGVIREVLPGDVVDGTENSGSFERLESLYTMQSERDAHTLFAAPPDYEGCASPESSGQAAVSTDHNSDSDLGDNVELF